MIYGSWVVTKKTSISSWFVPSESVRRRVVSSRSKCTGFAPTNGRPTIRLFPATFSWSAIRIDLRSMFFELSLFPNCWTCLRGGCVGSARTSSPKWWSFKSTLSASTSTLLANFVLDQTCTTFQVYTGQSGLHSGHSDVMVPTQETLLIALLACKAWMSNKKRSVMNYTNLGLGQRQGEFAWENRCYNWQNLKVKARFHLSRNFVEKAVGDTVWQRSWWKNNWRRRMGVFRTNVWSSETCAPLHGPCCFSESQRTPKRRIWIWFSWSCWSFKFVVWLSNESCFEKILASLHHRCSKLPTSREQWSGSSWRSRALWPPRLEADVPRAVQHHVAVSVSGLWKVLRLPTARKPVQGNDNVSWNGNFNPSTKCFMFEGRSTESSKWLEMTKWWNKNSNRMQTSNVLSDRYFCHW